MTRPPALVDRWGNPLNRARLADEIAAPTLGGVRSPLSGYPADGLNPLRLAAILREADAGDPLRYLELAETIEERDPHYLAVLSTRKRAVSQLDVTVESASDDPADIARADLVRDWLKRDELAEEMFDILDCLGKGVSYTEIAWDTSEGQWWPKALKRRDPRFFRVAQADLETPVMIGDDGREVPLEPLRFIHAVIAAKSGLPLRSGLARVALWGFMFKAFTQRDWAIFTQTYGQPLRVGRWGAGASEEDKRTLFRAVSQIAGDCAAIIPESMRIEFVESKSVGASIDLYERRADWLDRQISKAVLGQTATTDAIAGGHAVGREHRLVQEDIERADARALSAVLNRDLIRPWMDLEFGPARSYPRIVIARADQDDVTKLAQALGTLVPLGLRVSASDVRDRLGLAEPAEGDAVLAPAAAPAGPPGDGPEGGNAPVEAPGPGAAGTDGPIKAERRKIKGGQPPPGTEEALQASGRPDPLPRGLAPEAYLAAQMAEEARPAVDDLIAQIEAIFDSAGSLDEAREMLRAAWPQLDDTRLAARLAEGLIAAELAGRGAVATGDG